MRSKRKLQPRQFSVQSTLGDQLIVSALGHDAAAIEHHDAIHPLHGCQAVGDDQCGAALHQAVQRMLDGTLALRIQCTGGFIRSEEHTSELQSLMRISYAVVCSYTITYIMSTTTCIY